MIVRDCHNEARRFGLGTDCALLSMPDCRASYLMSFDVFVRHVRRTSSLVLCPWAEGKVRDDMERIRDNNFDWSQETTAFKIPSGVKTFVLSAFGEVNVPKMRHGRTVYSCWPKSEVRMALEDLGVAWEEPQYPDDRFKELLATVAERAGKLWPGYTGVWLEYDDAQAPEPKRRRLQRLNVVARDVLCWPVVRMVDDGQCGGAWCHYSPAVRKKAWDAIMEIEGAAK